jgi:hypothetical protein
MKHALGDKCLQSLVGKCERKKRLTYQGVDGRSVETDIKEPRFKCVPDLIG